MQTRKTTSIKALGVIGTLAVALGLVAWRVLRVLLSDDPAVWARAIARFKQQDRRNPPPPNVIVFTGSSSIRFWKTLQQDLAPLPVINRGFGGAKIHQVAYYADQIVTPYHPRAVVLFAGTNDIAWPKPKTAEQVFDGYVKFVRAVHAALPETPIYYIAITPTPSRWKYWPIVNAANQLIEAYTATDSRLRFIDMTGAMLGPDGQPDPTLYRIDKLHPSARGYALWTALIKPILEADLSR